ncbi:hypothetical protein G5B37_09060 [Rasiella rasia]|uniref:Peptidase S74 domain-containing protein n=1 Tax=Rasiella rasia TaxID=2744027 RepID=A0A6G6GMG0_9FLAO|nr:hypothetical protein [Rasiella rasia]QIE59707.1 hypothetical protein G5B37_09060 [Rasiella rasia]
MKYQKTRLKRPQSFKNLPNLCVFLLLFGTASLTAQVGINTTAPDPSAMLDIQASDKGVLIPKVSLANVTTTTLDGTNTAAMGLLIYNTNAAVTGGDGVGYYSFNGTTWEKLITSASSGLSDTDFYEEGTTTAPDDINDDIFTFGNVAIGKNTADYTLDLNFSGSGRTANINKSGDETTDNYGLFVTNSTTGSGFKYGTYNTITGTSLGSHFGTYNKMDAQSNQQVYGSYQDITGLGNGGLNATFNSISGTGGGDAAGVTNVISTDNGRGHYGTLNTITGNAGTNETAGTKTTINVSGNSGFRYGNINNITNNFQGRSYGISNTLLGTSISRQYGMANLISNTGDGLHYGVSNILDGTGGGAHTGTLNVLSNGGNGMHIGTDNSIQSFGTGTKIATRNTVNSGGSGSKYGSYNFINDAGTGNQYGVYSDVPRVTGYAGYFLGRMYFGTNTSNGYIFPSTRGTNGQIMQTDASGNIAWVDPASIAVTEWTDNGAYLSPADGATEAVNLGGSTSTDGKLNSSSTLTRNITLSTARNNGATSSIYNESSNQGTGLEANRAIHNILSSGGNAFDYGVYNEFIGDGSGGQSGVYNLITATNNSSQGVNTRITGASPSQNVGVQNTIQQNGTGEAYGTFSYLTGTGTGNKYGSLVRIPDITGGTHYGLYSAVQKSGSFAGFFAGDVAIGTQEYNSGAPDYYILPASRGTNNQIMQTDAAGNVSWIDPASIAISDADFYEYGTTTAPDDINDNIFTNGGLGINYNPNGAALAANALTNDIPIVARKDINSESTSLSTSVSSLLIGAYPSGMTGTRNLYLSTNVSNSNGGATNTKGINNVINATDVRVIGMETAINLTGNLSSFDHQGHTISFVGTGTGNKTGYSLFMNQNTAGNKIGFKSELNNGPGTKTGAHYSIGGAGASEETGVYVGILNNANAPEQTAYSTQLGATAANIRKGLEVEMYNGTGGTQYGTYITLENGAFGNNANLYGTYIQIPSATNANVQYGIYSDVQKSTGFAGYFLGNVSIGTSAANNYVLPSTRGTANQIMQTDALGNVSWVDNFPGYWSRTGTTLDVATAGDDINFTSDQTSITFAQAGATPETMLYMFNAGTNNADRMVLSQSPAFPGWGLQYRDSGDSFVFKSASQDRVEIDLAGIYPLRVYGRARAVDFESNTATYPDYVFENYFEGVSEINPAYNFKTLSEVEKFIKQNGHLPGVKAYEEIKAAGMKISLSETTIKNLEKIEELFLYSIEISKENKLLKEQLAAQEKRLEKIEKLLNQTN